MPSLCGSAEATREWFRAFTAHSFLACRPLRPRGVRHRYVPDLRCRHGLRRLTTGSALPKFPQSVSRGGPISWLHWFASAFNLVGDSLRYPLLLRYLARESQKREPTKIQIWQPFWQQSAKLADRLHLRQR